MPLLYESDDNVYYVVHLTEKVEHLFLPGFFDAMPAPVVAVAMITKTDNTSATTTAKTVNIVFTPGPDFENLREKVTFNLVSSRRAQAAVLKAEKSGDAVVNLEAARASARPNADSGTNDPDAQPSTISNKL